MIELKVGDRVRVYTINTIYFCATSHSGIIISIEINGLAIKVKFDNGSYAYYHRKQVRKLVKVKKCKECNGSGQYFPLHEPGTAIVDIYMICPKCNGKGKVRV